MVSVSLASRDDRRGSLKVSSNNDTSPAALGETLIRTRHAAPPAPHGHVDGYLRDDKVLPAGGAVCPETSAAPRPRRAKCVGTPLTGCPCQVPRAGILGAPRREASRADIQGLLHAIIARVREANRAGAPVSVSLRTASRSQLAQRGTEEGVSRDKVRLHLSSVRPSLRFGSFPRPASAGARGPHVRSGFWFS